MSKTKMLLLGALLASASSAFAAEPTTPTPPVNIQSLELQEFTADFIKYKIGDVVPALYRSDKYNIKEWKIRNLPAPDEGTHWTYIGGNYALITDAEGKVVKAYDGNIYHL